MRSSIAGLLFSPASPDMSHQPCAANNTCLRSCLCTLCANTVLQLDRPVAERFASDAGLARCIICRMTSVDAKRLTPHSAYVVNHALMDVMDALGMGANCRYLAHGARKPCDKSLMRLPPVINATHPLRRVCDLEFATQVELESHYFMSCPNAVVHCKFKACSQVSHISRVSFILFPNAFEPHRDTFPASNSAVWRSYSDTRA